MPKRSRLTGAGIVGRIVKGVKKAATRAWNSDARRIIRDSQVTGNLAERYTPNAAPIIKLLGYGKKPKQQGQRNFDQGRSRR